MPRTRLSLYYLATYLPIAGLALLFVPEFATKLLLSNRTYDEVFVRLAGAVLLAIGILVSRSSATASRSSTRRPLAIRLGLVVVLLWLYALSSDPFFLVIFVVVGFGVALTGTSYYLDRRDRSQVDRSTSS